VVVDASGVPVRVGTALGGVGFSVVGVAPGKMALGSAGSTSSDLGVGSSPLGVVRFGSGVVVEAGLVVPDQAQDMSLGQLLSLRRRIVAHKRVLHRGGLLQRKRRRRSDR
jgi:hypothetical protein